MFRSIKTGVMFSESCLYASINGLKQVKTDRKIEKSASIKVTCPTSTPYRGDILWRGLRRFSIIFVPNKPVIETIVCRRYGLPSLDVPTTPNQNPRSYHQPFRQIQTLDQDDYFELNKWTVHLMDGFSTIDHQSYGRIQAADHDNFIKVNGQKNNRS